MDEAKKYMKKIIASNKATPIKRWDGSLLFFRAERVIKITPKIIPAATIPRTDIVR